jgi:hypothetical protein
MNSDVQFQPLVKVFKSSDIYFVISMANCSQQYVRLQGSHSTEYQDYVFWVVM